LWDLVAGRPLKEFQHPDAQITSASFHPQEYLMATAGSDRRIRFWDLESMLPLDTLSILSRPLVLDFTSDGDTLVCAQTNGLQSLSWDPMGVVDALPLMHWDRVSDLAMHHDDCFVASFLHNVISLWVVHFEVNLMYLKALMEANGTADCRALVGANKCNHSVACICFTRRRFWITARATTRFF
jgi:katanin p80 WD40 repeat-containing subunit B1